LTSFIPNNRDAAFEKNIDKPKPSDLLLHYNYGAAAVNCWGRGKNVLENLAKPPRPVPMPTGPRTAQDRAAAIRARTGGLVESAREVQAWDADDVVMFFWANSPAARERNLKKVRESTRRIEQWREGVPHDSV
jgi:hypothetical protein